MERLQSTIWRIMSLALRAKGIISQWEAALPDTLDSTAHYCVQLPPVRRMKDFSTFREDQPSGLLHLPG